MQQLRENLEKVRKAAAEAEVLDNISAGDGDLAVGPEALDWDRVLGCVNDSTRFTTLLCYTPIRWLSFFQCVTRVVACWPAVIKTFEEVAADAGNVRAQAKARWLLLEMSELQGVMLFLADFGPMFTSCMTTVQVTNDVFLHKAFQILHDMLYQIRVRGFSSLSGELVSTNVPGRAPIMQPAAISASKNAVTWKLRPFKDLNFDKLQFFCAKVVRSAVHMVRGQVSQSGCQDTYAWKQCVECMQWRNVPHEQDEEDFKCSEFEGGDCNEPCSYCEYWLENDLNSADDEPCTCPSKQALRSRARKSKKRKAGQLPKVLIEPPSYSATLLDLLAGVERDVCAFLLGFQAGITERLLNSWKHWKFSIHRNSSSKVMSQPP